MKQWRKIGNVMTKKIKYILYLLGIITPLLQAGDVELKMSQPPYYVNVPVIFEVHAKNFEQSPQPLITVKQPPQGQLKLVDTNANVSSRIEIINGRMTQSKNVEFIYRYHLLAKAPGQYHIGPFIVNQEGDKEATDKVKVKVSTIPITGEQKIQLLVPEVVYLGQRVAIKVVWWVDRDLSGKIHQQQAFVPFFDKIDLFQFSDEEAKQTESQAELNINTPAGMSAFPASAEIRTDDDGKRYVVYTVKRIMIPHKVGQYDITPATVMVDKITRWQRSFFGKSAAESKTLQAMDKQRRIVVKAIPRLGRPNSFAGAVGAGFSIHLATNRSVVQAGDPMVLTITIGGGAAVENISLPDLAKSGLNEQQFRLPNADDITGIYEEGKKVFKVTIRVLKEAISSIPPVEFSWFNPDNEQYERSLSQPIALSVNKARIVSVDDVVASKSALKSRSKIKGLANNEIKEKSEFELNAMNLAIEKDLQKLLHSSEDHGYRNLIGITYVLSILMVILAIISRKRADIDPHIKQQKLKITQLHQQLQKAKQVDEVAKLLREWLASAITTLPYAEIDDLLAQCDKLTYAPAGIGSDNNNVLQQRALALFERSLERQK